MPRPLKNNENNLPSPAIIDRLRFNSNNQRSVVCVLRFRAIFTVRTKGPARGFAHKPPFAQRQFNAATPEEKQRRHHRSFPHAERHPITTRARSVRDQSSVSLSDANGTEYTDPVLKTR